MEAGVQRARVASILRVALDELNLYSFLSNESAASSSTTTTTSVGGDEVTRALRSQRVLEQEFSQLVAARAAGKAAGSHSAKLRELQREIDAKLQLLKQGMRDLSRTLQETPDVGDRSAQIRSEYARTAELLRVSLEEVQQRGHAPSLEAFVRSEEAAQGWMKVIAAEEEAARKVAEVAATIRDEEEAHQGAMGQLKGELAELKATLAKQRAEMVVSVRYARKEASAKGEATARIAADDEVMLRQQLGELESQLQSEQEVHTISMEALRREQESNTMKAAQARKQGESSVEAAALQILRLTKQRDKLKAELGAFQARYARDVVELQAKKSERRQQEEAHADAVREAARRAEAGATIRRIIGELFSGIQQASAAADAAKAEKAMAAKGKKK